MAKRKAAEAEVIDVPARVSPDELDAQQSAGALGAFFKGLGQFFTTATALEVRAKETLVQARALTMPTNGAADETIQRFVRETSAQKKEVEQHWTITSTVASFHRKLTAKRGIATAALDEANAIGNRLHNAYTEAEKRRAQQEEDRINREKEQRAREERDRETARLEAEAVAREEASGDLSDREMVFVRHTVERNMAAQQAAQMAGYKDALKSAARLMTLPKIVAAIKAQREAAALRQQAAAKKAAPIEIEREEVRPDISKAAGGFDRTNWTGEILDAQATVRALIAGNFGIPADLFTIDQTKLNEYARSLHERLDLWPGVRAKKSTKVI